MINLPTPRALFSRLFSAFTLIAVSPAGAQLAGELGILDLSANDGNNPLTGSPWEAGDQYRLLFVTSATTTAESTDIEVYNTFVQGVADAAGIGGIWKIAASTETVDAVDNTGSDPAAGVGVPVFLMDGRSLVAINNEELWNGTDVAISLDENGVLVETNVDRIYTGSEANGRKVTNGRTLGGDTEGRVRTGRADFPGGRWMRDFNVPSDQQRRVFAISDPLTVSTGAGGGLLITSIDYDLEANTLSLTWNSVPGQIYAVTYSTDMLDWGFDLDDGIEGAEGSETTANFSLEDFPEIAELSRAFFRVEIP